MRFVARQTILTADEKVFGYELLFRDGLENIFSAPDADSASRSTLNTSMLIGLDTLCDGTGFHQLHSRHPAQGVHHAAAFGSGCNRGSGNGPGRRPGDSRLPTDEASRIHDC